MQAPQLLPDSLHLQGKRCLVVGGGSYVYLELPPTEVLDQILATELGCRLATACDTISALVASV